MGSRDHYGHGAHYEVDSSRPMTVVTQFLTHNETDEGILSEIRRFYVQDPAQVGELVYCCRTAHGGDGREAGVKSWDLRCGAAPGGECERPDLFGASGRKISHRTGFALSRLRAGATQILTVQTFLAGTRRHKF